MGRYLNGDGASSRPAITSHEAVAFKQAAVVESQGYLALGWWRIFQRRSGAGQIEASAGVVEPGIGADI